MVWCSDTRTEGGGWGEERKGEASSGGEERRRTQSGAVVAAAGEQTSGGAEGSWVRLALGFRCGAASMCTDGWDAVLLDGRLDGVFGGQSVGGKSLRSDWPDTMTLDQGFNK
jgi:hypothetical protein